MPTESHDSSSDRQLDDLIGGGQTIAMVMTMVGGRHTSRPVTCAEVVDGRVSFLVSNEVDWVKDIAAGRAVVHVTVADESKNTYLALNGSAFLTQDREECARLWTPIARAWFEGPDDPTLGVLRFVVADGEYWDGPSGMIGKALGLARAVLTGDERAGGSHGSVSTT